MLFLFMGMSLMVIIDKSNINDMVDLVLNNTDIKDIEYVNKYNSYYIVIDKKYVYLLDSKYEEILRINSDKIYNNKNNYDIVYRDDTLMYMDNYKNDEGLVFKYYDIYTYEFLDEVIIGGS